MRRLSPLLLLLLGCPPPDPPPDETDSTVETDTVDPPVVTPTDSDSDPLETDTPPPSAILELGDPVVCADPSLRETAPYVLHEPGGDWANQAFDPRSSSLFVGGSLAMGDYNDDGWLDIVLSDLGTEVQYFQGNADLGFTDRSAELPPMPAKTTGLTSVDLEGDGDLDVIVTVFKGENLALINDGTGSFTEQASLLGLSGTDTNRTMSSSWADIDGDGDLDGFFGGYGRLSQAEGGLPDGDSSALMIRGANGTYTDIMEATYPLDHPMHRAHTFGGAFVDVDLDGDLDLFMVNDFGWRFPTIIMRNNNGSLEWWENAGPEQPRENMGLGVGDVNGDELPDFLVAAWDVVGLFASRSGTWFDISQARNLTQDHDRGQRVAWGAELADVDNDTDLDAGVVYGYLNVRSNNVNPDDQPDALYLRQEDGTYEDVAPAWGIDDLTRSRGFLFVDLDRNGWLDIVKRDLRGPTKIYLAQCGEASWTSIDLRQPGPNPFAIGARVRVINREGGVLTRTMFAGGTSYASGGPPELHYGLGDQDTIATIEVHWPDGAVDQFHDVDARRHVRIVRP